MKAEVAAPVVVEDTEFEAPAPVEAEDATVKPKRPRARRTTKTAAAQTENVAVDTAAQSEDEAPAKPKRTRRTTKATKAKAEDTTGEDSVLQPINIDELPPATRRVGWWKR
ncbi:ribonuclease E [Gluconobacter japonicus]|nr:ribonuclease E [Gluconobacter japonicus]